MWSILDPNTQERLRVTRGGTIQTAAGQTTDPRGLTLDQRKAMGVYEYRETNKPDRFRRSTGKTRQLDHENAIDADQHTLAYKPLADLRALREQDITAAFYRYRDAGTTVTFGGQDVRVETTHAAQTELQGLVSRLERVGGTQRIVTRSGSLMEVDLATATVLRDAIEQHLSNCYTNDAELRGSLGGLNESELEEFDPEAGWPPIPESN